MGVCKCKNCEREFEGYGNNKYCSEECVFESKSYSVDLETGCWNWQGATDWDGYGTFGYNNKQFKAHRFSCELAHGKAPEGKNLVLHSCDHPSCVNPSHLRWGSASENSKDMTERNRSAKGSKQGGSKLTESDVIDIKNKLQNYKLGDYSDLAKQFNVCRATIKNIHNGTNWKHI